MLSLSPNQGVALISCQRFIDTWWFLWNLVVSLRVTPNAEYLSVLDDLSLQMHTETLTTLMPCTYPCWKLTALPGHYWILHGYKNPALALCTGRAWIPGGIWWPGVMQKVITSAHRVCEALDRSSFLVLACCHFHTSHLCEWAGGMSEDFRTGIGDETQLPAIRSAILSSLELCTGLWSLHL